MDPSKAAIQCDLYVCYRCKCTMAEVPGNTFESKTPIEVAEFLKEKGIPELTCEVFEGECSSSESIPLLL